MIDVILPPKEDQHPMSLVSWQSWIDDLPLPLEFEAGQNALQEYLQFLADQNNRLRAAFRVNMLRYGPPGISHAEIDAALQAAATQAEGRGDE